MNISRVSETSGVDPLQAIRPNEARLNTKKPAETSATSFVDVVKNAVMEANDQQSHADEAMKQLVTGNVDNIHDVVLSVAKADLSFRFLMEVRNKVTEAYQEISRMQL